MHANTQEPIYKNTLRTNGNHDHFGRLFSL